MGIEKELTIEQLREKHADVLNSPGVQAMIRLKRRHEGNLYDSNPYQIDISKEVDDARTRMSLNPLLKIYESANNLK